MAAFSSNLRSSCSLPNLLFFLNLLLFLLSGASFAPLLLIRTPPSPFGWVLFAVSSTTLLSSLLSFCSHFMHSISFFISHISLLLASSVGQALAYFSLFICPDRILGYLMPERSPIEVKVLLEIEEWAMIGMFALGSIVLVLECFVQSWWVKEYEVEAEAAAAAAAAAANKRVNRRTGRVRVESVVESESEGGGAAE